MNLLYQNNETGDALDITTLVTSAKWTTKRSGSPASLELSVLKDDVLQWSPGGILALKDGNTGIFYGYVVKIKVDEGGETEVTAYDQVWYLKQNTDTYVFTGKRADEITAMVAADFGVSCGALANTGYAIPSMIKDGETLLDIVLEALDRTLVSAGKMYFLWDDFGSLRISDVEEEKLDLILGDKSFATGFSQETSIDSETYNQVKLVRDNKETGKRDVYLFQDSGNIAKWGTLQYFETVDETLNEGQIKERGSQMLELYNRPKRAFEVDALLDLSVRAGRAVCIQIAEIGVSAYYILEEVSSDLVKGTMRLKLKVV